MYSQATHDRARVAGQSDCEADAASHVGKLTDVLFGPLADLAIQNLRVRPRQARSLESVGRILSVAAEMAFRRGEMKAISIESISIEAGVTPQAAYRYFKDVENLIRIGLRCVMVREHERIVAKLSSCFFVDEREMARAVVAIVLDTCERFHLLPSDLKENILGEYRQFGYDASHHMAEVICRDLNGGDVRQGLDVFRISAALTAIIAVATSFVIKGFFSLRDARFENMLTDLFITVVQTGVDSSAAVREAEGGIDALWMMGAG